MHQLSHFRNLLLIAAGLWGAGSAAAQDCAASCDQATVCDSVATLLQGQAYEGRVNTFTYSTQHEQALDIAEDGRILVAWASRRQEAGSYGVFAQLVDGLGRPLGTELHINEYLPGAQFQPAVAFTPQGHAFVAWCSQSGQDGEFGGIYLRRLAELEEAQDANSFGPVGGEIQVNQSVAGDQQNPTLLALANGNLVASWVSTDVDGKARAMARLFDADGQPVGDEFALGQSCGAEALPVLAQVEGGFVASWARTGAQAGVYARSFDAQGAPQGDESLLVADAIEPALDSDGSGRLALAWMGLDCSGEYRVHGQLLSACLKLQGEAWVSPKAAEGHYVNAASVAMGADGRHVVAYTMHEPAKINEAGRPGSQSSILGQEFDAQGQAVGQPTRLNQMQDGLQDLRVGRNARHMAMGAQGQLAMTWYGHTNDDGKGIGLTVFAPDNFAPEAPEAITPVAALEGLRPADVRKQIAPPEWDPNWVDDSEMTPASGPAGPDFGFDGKTSTGWNPPDPDLAVGPNHVVVVVNVDMEFRRKSDGVSTSGNIPLESWFNTNGFVFDPVALYDENVNRYVVAAVEHNGGDFFNIAVSDDDDPNGTWYKYRFNVSSICGFIDFPNLGMSKDAYYLIADCFSTPRGNNIHVMDKAPMLSGAPVTLNSINTTSSIISNGAVRNYDDGTLYAASTYAAGSPFLRLYSVEDPTGAATLRSYNLNVGSFSNPPDAQQQGTSNRADTIDHRIKNGVMRDGYLYLCHAVANGGVAKVRWYKIDLNGWPLSGGAPTLADSGYVNPGSGVYTWMGDINVDADGTMAIAYSRSSSSEFISVERTWREAADAAGTVRDFTQMQVSTSPETGSRWGDYSGLEEDPFEPGTFWSHNEYRTSSWRTWVGRFTPGDGNELTLTLSLPLVAGQGNSATVDGTVPFTNVFLYNGSGPGSTTIPGLGDLDINNASQVWSGAANAAGTANVNRYLPFRLRGRTVFVQAIDALGETSNVETTTIQ